MPNYYPVMLDVRERSAIVIGGDGIAAEKATALANSGARVCAFSPEFGAEMLTLAEHGQVTLRRKGYEPGDLEGAFVVVAATNDAALIEAIWQETQQLGQPVNIVDIPRYCTFILPSILRRGKLTVAVSTEGASPSLAKRIRQQLEEVLPAAYAAYIDLAALARAHLRRQGVSDAVRDEFFREFMDSSILALLNADEVAQALAISGALLRKYGLDITDKQLEQAFINEQQESYALSRS